LLAATAKEAGKDVPQPEPRESGGILQSVRDLAATAVALIQTRFELLVTELEEERVRLLQLLLWVTGALFFTAIGILLLSILVVAIFWDEHRILALSVLSGIFLAAGFGMAVGVGKRIKDRPGMFSASLGELGKDKDQLRDSRPR